MSPAADLNHANDYYTETAGLTNPKARFGRDVFVDMWDTDRPAHGQVIPTPLHVLGRISPIFSPFFLVFCAFSPSRRGGSNEPQAGTQG